jgi:hydroxypyruvate isomerase
MSKHRMKQDNLRNQAQNNRGAGETDTGEKLPSAKKSRTAGKRSTVKK